jgi:hypothetical protein
MSATDTDVDGSPRRSDRIVFALLLIAITGLVLTLPFTLSSIRNELFGIQVAELWDFPTGEPVKLAVVQELENVESFYNITLFNVNEDAGSIDIAFSGNRECPVGSCPEMNVTLIAYNSDVVLRRGLPPAETVKINKDDFTYSEQVTLPIVGWPSQYPFDRYRLRLGVAFAEVVDGKKSFMPAGDVAGYSYGTIQNATRDFIMGQPVNVPEDQVFNPSDPFTPAGVQDIVLRRPTYLWVLSVTLVTLITVSSMLSLLSRSVSEALVGIGSLVLGVWGIRSVLVPSGLGVVTSIDITLSLVIMLLLFGLTLRSAGHFRRRSNIQLPKRFSKPDQP